MSAGGETNVKQSGALAARVHLELLACPPYSTASAAARVTRDGCADRWELANQAGRRRQRGMGPWHQPRHLERCKGCEHGRSRSDERGEERAERKRERDRERLREKREAASCAAPAPEEHAAAETEARADEAPQAGTETAVQGSRRWCSANAETPRPPRRVGAPPPAAGPIAEAWRGALARDPAELARVVELIAARVPAVGNAPLQARGALLRRLGEWPLGAVVDELRARGAPENLDSELMAKWVERGAAIVDEAVRQMRLFDEAPEVHALADLVGAIVRARRSDAGRPRPKARGARARKVESTTDDTHVPLLGAGDTEAA